MGIPLGAWAEGTPRRLLHGDVVVRQGDLIESLFLVSCGVVRLSSVTRGGREVVVGLLGVGDLFGESALLGRPSPVEARAVGSADLVSLPLRQVREILIHHPGTSAELLRLVAFRLHRTSQALEEALTGTLTARLSGRLRDLADAHGIRAPEGVRIGVRLTRDELARMVGSTRESVSRTLGGLATQGLVATDDHGILIPDPDALDVASTAS